MDGFLEILYKVGAEPWSWAVVVLLAAWAGVSLWKRIVCPIANGHANLTSADAIREMNRKVRHPLSFLVLMIGGMVAAVVGLFGLSKADEGAGTLPFFLLAAGLFVILTLPVRMRIREAELRVRAATNEEGRLALARSLRSEHHALLQYEFGILALIALILVAF